MDTDDVVVIVNALPTANAGPDKWICWWFWTQLEGSGGGTYSWSPTIGLSSPNIANPFAKPPVTTEYTLTVTDSNGCQDTDKVIVWVCRFNWGTSDGADPDLNDANRPTGTANVSVAESTRFYPNPVRDVIHLEFTSAMVDKAVLNVYDPLGRILHSEAFTATAGLNTRSVRLDENLAEGWLVAELIIGGEATRVKLLRF